MTLYAFLYNSCIYESAAQTMSLHRTKKGAYKAMRKHRWDSCVENREMRLNLGNERYWQRYYKEGAHEWWGTMPIKVEV